jgi:hypothetical protein
MNPSVSKSLTRSADATGAAAAAIAFPRAHELRKHHRQLQPINILSSNRRLCSRPSLLRERRALGEMAFDGRIFKFVMRFARRRVQFKLDMPLWSVQRSIDTIRKELP